MEWQKDWEKKIKQSKTQRLEFFTQKYKISASNLELAFLNEFKNCRVPSLEGLEKKVGSGWFGVHPSECFLWRHRIGIFLMENVTNVQRNPVCTAGLQGAAAPKLLEKLETPGTAGESQNDGV